MSIGRGDQLPIGEEAWGDTVLMLRKGLTAGTYVDVLTERRVSVENHKGKPVLSAAQVFQCLPVALLRGDDGMSNE